MQKAKQPVCTGWSFTQTQHTKLYIYKTNTIKIYYWENESAYIILKIHLTSLNYRIRFHGGTEFHKNGAAKQKLMGMPNCVDGRVEDTGEVQGS